MAKKYNVAVAGATGAVGHEMISTLEERNFPVDELRLLASERSAGKTLKFKGKNITVRKLEYDSFKGIDYALFSAGASRSLEFAPKAVESGTIVIDNSSAFRMEKNVPLVVPEVNPHDLKKHSGIISNPNCSTIQMVVVLKPLNDYAKIKRVVVSTYQAVSGAGGKAMEELMAQTKAFLSFKEIEKKVFPHQIAFNCIPHIDSFLENGYTKEEIKMVNETKKIMGDSSILVTATTVRVPVFHSHSESVNVEFEKEITPEKARELLSKADGVEVVDNPAEKVYPLAINAAGKDPSYVGRIRKDDTVKYGLNMWIVSDNLRKGAALNAVQIAERLIKGDY
ncbi:MAG: aspartate-semialdehyde dehydrogenase [Candidatus Schekmanbacteria bacterium RBG_16_38_11]|uniref:Aspartate-semialdehyde dehydrogenase n=1 Tax=Candidatus Schekmanbacteria bacterium RBG_16_38_11 TaxID=1817880 RepID=A0A1F7RZR2_9BACT|nr:MAG: aspartate-semialdehyde dehydrogenase [Candidatus Schekmanbacteria bacterium RBG_16_38_11]